MAPVEVDGSYLEGGGQIVRVAVGLSAATGKPCHISAIRKGRPNPGLAAQHLAGVRAAASLCGAEVRGDEAGSTELEFRPSRLTPPARVTVNVGTAGAVTLVAQALLIPLAVADRDVEVVVTGGTHVQWAPTTDYLAQVSTHYLAAMGMSVLVLDVQPGFFPRGGGKMRLVVTPGPLSPLTLTKQGELELTVARSIASEELRKANVAERQLEGAGAQVDLDDQEARYVSSASIGSAVHLTVCCGTCRLGASALGRRGRPAERVGRDAAQALAGAIRSGACLDAHMADQILPYLALAGGRSEVAVEEITDHCRTSIRVIEQFLPARFSVDERRRLVVCEA
jgi:RNA 3'-phosphate cyclase